MRYLWENKIKICGHSLIETMIVLMILAILATIALVCYGPLIAKIRNWVGG